MNRREFLFTAAASAASVMVPNPVIRHQPQHWEEIPEQYAALGLVGPSGKILAAKLVPFHTEADQGTGAMIVKIEDAVFQWEHFCQQAVGDDYSDGYVTINRIVSCFDTGIFGLMPFWHPINALTIHPSADLTVADAKIIVT